MDCTVIGAKRSRTSAQREVCLWRERAIEASAGPSRVQGATYFLERTPQTSSRDNLRRLLTENS